MTWRTVILTIPVIALLTQPLWAPAWGAGILGEVARLGPVGATVAVATFFGLVALYVISLQRLLTAVPVSARRRTVRSVWLMFAIPLNFVEDFDIIHDIAASLRLADGRDDPAVARWRVLGIVWCALQILSLFPGPVGVLSGTVALLAWAAHWVLTERLRRRRTLVRTTGDVG